MGIKNYTSNVDASVSLGEIQAALARAGALQIMVDYDNGEPQAVSFGMMGPCGKIGFKLPAPLSSMMDQAKNMAQEILIMAQKINAHMFGVSTPDRDEAPYPKCFQEVLTDQLKTLNEATCELAAIMDKLGV